MAVSATDTSHCQSGTEGFDHISVILDAYDVNDFVARWLGHPLEKPIHFELSALPPATAIQWNLAVSCLQKALLMSPVPETLMHALYEHMLKLVATGHRNSYSNLMTSDHCVAEQQARAALSMIEADPMRWGTLGSIAITLRCAIASLENGILRLTGRTARDLFFEARLRGVHRALSKGGERTFVGTLRQFGFNLSDQFILAYRLRFGEPPSVTYRKNCHALEASDLRLDARDVFSRAAIDKFVDLHLSSSISLADIATHMGESKVWMMRVFKAQFGVTPTQYIIERRLEKARWMLVNTSDSILSIALQCGFAGQSYFTTQIKRRYGVTPRQLRISSAS
ncbi:AraC family transcriptional regulator [Pandoraea sp. SD6-2]|nr:AraC family transcriptional regulator [Pandoraea sp. SD6-2]